MEPNKALTYELSNLVVAHVYHFILLLKIPRFYKQFKLTSKVLSVERLCAAFVFFEMLMFVFLFSCITGLCLTHYKKCSSQFF